VLEGDDKVKGKKIKYSVSLAVLASTMLATPAFASPIDSTKALIGQTQVQINDFETKIQQLDNQITDEMVKSQKLNDDMKAQQAKIDATKAEIEKAKKDLDAHKKVYAERLQSIQAQGQQPIITYAELLFSSNNISEFLTRSTAISQFIQSDTDLLNGLNSKEQALNSAEEQLHSELDNLKNSQVQLASDQQKIEAAKQEVEKQLADSKNSLQQQQASLQSQQQQALQAQQQAQQQLAQQTSAPVSNFSSNAANLTNPDKASKVIAYAEQFLGIPYVWGGTSPSGFDCSGLMQYVFRSVGVNLPRVAASQQNVGTRISPSQVQPGDLVFEGNPAYHVGMYIGGGKWIQAPETGDVVKISPFNPSSFSSAARILR
jgi:cell wall-associated NlpC family hydrolase